MKRFVVIVECEEASDLEHALARAQRLVYDNLDHVDRMRVDEPIEEGQAFVLQRIE